jgi:UDP-glucose 4-epimerase
VYGPRQNTEGEAGVIAIFLDLISQGREIQIHGDGAQSRDFIYVKDVAKAFVSALEKRVSGVYNIGTGFATSINELFQSVKEVSPGSISMQYSPVRPGDIQNSVLDNSHAKRNLSWEPEYMLKDGIQETSNYYFSKLHA